jgi:thiosulfate/3-mercaptopyruvate sulfurtransferase
MKAMQVKLSTRVVLYESKKGQAHLSTRAYYLFTLMGHQNVSVLNGGLTKWMIDGNKVESE